MSWWLGFSPIKLRCVARQQSEGRPPRVRSLPHGQSTVKLGRKENSFRVWVQNNLLRVKVVNARQIFSRHRVRIVTALPYVGDRNPAMPDTAGLVAQEVERVDKGRSFEFWRRIEQQCHACGVLSIDGKVEDLVLVNPCGAERQGSAFGLLPGHSLRLSATSTAVPTIKRKPALWRRVLHDPSLTVALESLERSNLVG